MAQTPEYEMPIDAERRPAEPDGRQRFPVKIKRILVPTDLTNESHRAIEFGLLVAKPLGAHLTLLHVYQEPSYAVEYVLGPCDSDRAQRERTYFEKTLKATAEDLKKDHADCDSEFRDGVPCEEIINAAREGDIDLIIVSTHHYNWLTRLAFGCDAEHIFRNLPCPILILQANTTPGEAQ
jgi:nucleotide-binding universal stress UspA family protein